ncbi:Arc family DNA-binding protein (plasmid) [Paracoccus sp. TD-10]|uniref:Arc family DNA-binding protein n=1 Tax=Paracoccus sp. TD-10 TaxID=3395918 RepID=UPI003AADAA94
MAEESSRAWKDQYMLRLPDGMRDRIKAAAEANNRSMNAEIVATLEKEYPAPPMSLNDIIITLLERLRGAPASEHQSIADAVNAQLKEANLPYEVHPEVGHDGRPVLQFAPRQG